MTEPESVPRAESVVSQNSGEEKDQTNSDPDQSSGETTANVQDDVATKNLSWIDRLLVVWILIAMAVGLILGNFVPNTKDALARGQFVGVSIPILVGLLVMMYPILCRVRYESIHKIFSERQLWEQMSFSFVVNWMIAPFVMLALAWAFLPDNSGLREGLIMVGIARCIAMVLIWTDLSNGDNEYCAVLVAFNSVLQIVLFAPYSIFFIKVISKDDDVAMISYSVVAKSVAVFLGIPFGAAIITRFTFRAVSEDAFNVYLRIISPFSLLGLIYTIIVLFAAQGSSVVSNITSVLRVIPPLVVYFVIMFFATWYVCRIFKWQYELGCAQSFTAASNNFELAIAVAVATFGIDSKQALATTVGPLIEVPVLATLVHFANWMHRRDLTRPNVSSVSG
jgi:ACR3 family arsenite transporter